MNDVNWWLVALSFVLGLVLTGVFMIRRVTFEVPVAAGPATAAALTADPPATVAPKVVLPEPLTVDEPPLVPHGPGSAKPGAGGRGPEGWLVKGNEESKLYHSSESPSFGVTRAEVWFRDVETAEAAGFNRWDSGKSQRGKK